MISEARNPPLLRTVLFQTPNIFAIYCNVVDNLRYVFFLARVQWFEYLIYLGCSLLTLDLGICAIGKNGVFVVLIWKDLDTLFVLLLASSSLRTQPNRHRTYVCQETNSAYQFRNQNQQGIEWKSQQINDNKSKSMPLKEKRADMNSHISWSDFPMITMRSLLRTCGSCSGNSVERR